MLDSTVVGTVIQKIREEHRQSQELVSGLAGIGRSHLSAIERGERKPTMETSSALPTLWTCAPAS